MNNKRTHDWSEASKRAMRERTEQDGDITLWLVPTEPTIKHGFGFPSAIVKRALRDDD